MLGLKYNLLIYKSFLPNRQQRYLPAQRSLLHPWGECQSAQPLREQLGSIYSNLKRTYLRPSNLTPGIDLRDVLRHAHKWLVHGAHGHIARNSTTLECELDVCNRGRAGPGMLPAAGEYYAALKRKAAHSLVLTGGVPEPELREGKGHLQSDVHSVTLLVRKLQPMFVRCLFCACPAKGGCQPPLGLLIRAPVMAFRAHRSSQDDLPSQVLNDSWLQLSHCVWQGWYGAGHICLCSL